MKIWPREPFGQAVAILVISYVLVDLGIPYIPPLFGFASAPVPNSVATANVAIAQRVIETIMSSVSPQENEQVRCSGVRQGSPAGQPWSSRITHRSVDERKWTNCQSTRIFRRDRMIRSFLRSRGTCKKRTARLLGNRAVRVAR